MWARKTTQLVLLSLIALGAQAPAGAVATANAASPNYFDNRGNAMVLLQSYFNALNRQEYARAYGYWESAGAAGPFAQFQAGYAGTQSVLLTTGAVGGSAGAGQRYYIVPVVLQAATTSGAVRTFAGCYVLHLALPALQTAPPFHPLGIASANILPVNSGANTATVQAQACAAAGLGGATPVMLDALPSAPESGAAYYIDDRSGPLETLQSLFNALNRQEYARAYGYWENQWALGSFAAFQQGYANTQSVQWAWGPLSSDAGAGQLYYTVPVMLKVQRADGVQTFVGCYRLHLSQPGLQAQPPFRPLGIVSAKLGAVANNANTNALMQTACPNPAPGPTPTGTPAQIAFAAGATSGTATGVVLGGDVQEYRLRAGAQQLMWVDLSNTAPNIYLEIYGRTDGNGLLLAAAKATHWQGVLPASQEYLIRVISKGDGASFLLQVTIPRRVSFARGAVSASTAGTLAAGAVNSYVLRALAGQTMTAAIPMPNAGLALEIYGVTNGQPLVRASLGLAHWTGKLPASQDYLVKVVSTNPASSSAASYTLNTTIR